MAQQNPQPAAAPAYTPIPLGKTDWVRNVAGEVPIQVLNRFFEANPTNLEDQVALIARPGLKRWLSVGPGPIRAIYSQPGSFNDALFVVSGDQLYQIDTDETITLLGGGIFGSPDGSPTLVATASLETVPEYLYIADGRNLWLYTDNAQASGELTASGSTIANGDTILLDAMYYQWTTGSVDTGTPDGSSGNPWLVAIGIGAEASLNSMRLATTAQGTAGTDYSSALLANPTIMGAASTATTLYLQAVNNGSAGDALVTTVISGSDISFGAATLSGGGLTSLTTVLTPDNVGVTGVAFLDGFVFVVIAQGFGVDGRFYWIDPGDTFIDPLNFATAESSPDSLTAIRVVGDQIWMLGTNSIEIWTATGDPTDITPFQRIQGRLFRRGTWPGTDMQVKDSVILVDSDAAVYRIDQLSYGFPSRVSDPSIEERIRDAIRIADINSG